MSSKYKIPGYKKGTVDYKRMIPNEHQLKMIEKKVYERYDREHQGDIDLAIVNCVAISMMALRKLWGFGPKRMAQFFEEYCHQMNCIAEEYVSLQDFIDIIYDECKVPIDSEEVALANPGLVKARKRILEENRKAKRKK